VRTRGDFVERYAQGIRFDCAQVGPYAIFVADARIAASGLNVNSLIAAADVTRSERRSA